MSVADRIRELATRASRPPWWVNDGHYIAFFGNDADDSKHHVGTPNAMAAEASTDAELTALLGTHAEALADLADAARSLLADAEDAGWDEGSAAAGQVESALDRLDGGDGQGRRWWHAFGKWTHEIESVDRDTGEVGPSWQRSVVGPSPVTPGNAPADAFRLGMTYLASWDHEPSEAEKDAIDPPEVQP